MIFAGGTGLGWVGLNYDFAGGSAHLEEGGLSDLTVGSLPKAEIWLKTEDPAVTVNANMLTRSQRGGRHCLQVPNAKNHPSFNF